MFPTFHTAATVFAAAALTTAATSAMAAFEAYDYLAPGESLTYTDVFPSGVSSFADLCGDGMSDLDLFVYDENGNLVASSESAGSCEYVEWNPYWTGTFHVEVYNYGNATSEFRLVAAN